MRYLPLMSDATLSRSPRRGRAVAPLALLAPLATLPAPLAFLVLFIATPSSIAAQPETGGEEALARVRYEVQLGDRWRHQARIEARFEQPQGSHLDLVMSRTSPGRYAVHDFAKNVYDVEAVDQRGWKLPLQRSSPHSWRVDLADGPTAVRLRYTLYADRCDGTYSAIDRSHAHLNAPATFVWARGFESLPHEVRFELPPGWRIATQLPYRSDGRALRAVNLQELLDSPMEVSDHEVYGFTVGDVGTDPPPQEILVALHHQGSDAEAREFVAHTEAIVGEAVALFGEAPRLDHGRYTFLADYLPWCVGDGMEHRNSTVLTSSRSLAERSKSLLGTVAHEFFHAWNIERMRPASLEPFDFERANMSDALWFGEGFTSYYDRLLTLRAGVVDIERFAERIGGVVDAVLRAPATKRSSPVEASRQAPFVDAAVANDPNNRENTFLSYYTWGAGIALALDLELRALPVPEAAPGKQPGRSLDGYLRKVWAAHGEVNQPYTLADLERLLGEYSGDSIWAQDFFARFVFDGNAPDYQRLLGRAGFLVRRAAPQEPWLGVRLAEADGAVEIVGNPIEGGPADRAELGRGDRIVAIEGRPVVSLEALRSELEAVGPAGAVSIEIEAEGELRQHRVRLQANPRWEVVLQEGTPSPAVQAFRNAWLLPRRMKTAAPPWIEEMPQSPEARQ